MTNITQTVYVLITASFFVSFSGWADDNAKKAVPYPGAVRGYTRASLDDVFAFYLKKMGPKDQMESWKGRKGASTVGYSFSFGSKGDTMGGIFPNVTVWSIDREARDKEYTQFGQQAPSACLAMLRARINPTESGHGKADWDAAAAKYRVLRYAIGNSAKAVEDNYSLPAGASGATGVQPGRPRQVSDEEQAAFGDKMQKLMAEGRTTEALQLMQEIQGHSVAAAQAHGGGTIAGDWNHWMKCLQEESEAATFTAIERSCGSSTECPPGD